MAIKLLHRELPRDERDLEYLTDCLSREARAAAAFNTRYRQSLRLRNDEVERRLHGHGNFSPENPGRAHGPRVADLAERAVQIMLPVAEGLDIVHVHGIVHRDLKPGNIFLAAEGQRRIQPEIVDFGIAKLPWLPPHPALPGDAVLGTPAYMAPEQARGSEEVDSRADVWSFCVVLYELVSGVVPSPGAGTQVFRALAEDPGPLAGEQRTASIERSGASSNKALRRPRRQVAQHSMGRRSTR